MNFLIEIPVGRIVSPDEVFIVRPEISLHVTGADHELLCWGDPISDGQFKSGFLANPSVGHIVNNLCGHYYYLFYDKKEGRISVGNSMFSILPVYYHTGDNVICLSDNAFDLARHEGLNTISKRFVLESVLFNYPLFNHAVIEGIFLLPSNSAVSAGAGRVSIDKHTNIEELFWSDPAPTRKSAGRMTGVFLQEVKKYLPGDGYCNALTGGFDGRTLCAAALFHKRSFDAYCFGTDGSSDRELAKRIASGAGIPFYDIVLGEDYFRDHSLEDGKRFITGSSGTATFARAHYIYASNLLRDRTGYIVTGNFGSEVFRAMHMPGVVISGDLFSVFSSASAEEAAKKLRTSSAWRWLNREGMETVMADLENDLTALPCFSEKYNGLSLNARFYVFVFEEMFRKYFGAEIINQLGILKNRTPFLDINFLRELFSTRFAGIYSDFSENNPLKRYKGQMFYAYVIKEAYPLLGKYPTDRGYRPADLVSWYGMPSILTGYMRKEAGKRDKSADPNGVRKAWMLNRSFYESLPLNRDFFSGELLQVSGSQGYSGEAARCFSLIYADFFTKQLLSGNEEDSSANRL